MKSASLGSPNSDQPQNLNEEEAEFSVPALHQFCVAQRKCWVKHFPATAWENRLPEGKSFYTGLFFPHEFGMLCLWMFNSPCVIEKWSGITGGRLKINAELFLHQDCGMLLYRIIVVLLNQDKLNLYPPGSHKVDLLLCHAWCFISFIRRAHLLRKITLASCSESSLLDISIKTSKHKEKFERRK